MQINAINSTFSNPKRQYKKSSIKNNYAISSSISFKGNAFIDRYAKPTYFDTIKEIALSKSENISKKANEIKSESKDIFSKAKSKFEDAQNLILFGQELYFREYKDIKNNIHIAFSSSFDDSKIDTLEEYDSKGNIIKRTVFDENLKPIIICEYSPENNEYNEYSIQNGMDNLTYMEGVTLFDGENFKINKRYAFANGKISQYEEKYIQYLDIKKSSEVFTFNSEENLQTFKSYFTNFNILKEEIYEYENKKLKSYSKNSNASQSANGPKLKIKIEYKN